MIVIAKEIRNNPVPIMTEIYLMERAVFLADSISSALVYVIVVFHGNIATIKAIMLTIKRTGGIPIMSFTGAICAATVAVVSMPKNFKIAK